MTTYFYFINCPELCVCASALTVKTTFPSVFVSIFDEVITRAKPLQKQVQTCGTVKNFHSLGCCCISSIQSDGMTLNRGQVLNVINFSSNQ